MKYRIDLVLRSKLDKENQSRYLNNMIKRVIFLALLLMASPFEISSEVLGTAEFSVHNSNYGYEANLPLIMLQVQTGYKNPDGEFSPLYILRFNDTRLDSTDVDTILVAEVDEYHFPGTVGYLTDNESQYVGVAFYLPSRNTGYGGPVAYELEQVAFSLDSTDFYGADIESISIRLDALTFDVVDGNWFEVIDFFCRVTVIVEGTWDNVPIENESWGAIKIMYRK